jgi:translation initiation factor IF-1
MSKQVAKILEALPNYNFRVQLNNGKEVRAYVSGKMRMNKIQVLPGDNVEVELPDGSQIARIIYRR